MRKTNVSAIVGVQYGDEGKGRIVDYFAQDADIVILDQENEIKDVFVSGKLIRR